MNYDDYQIISVFSERDERYRLWVTSLITLPHEPDAHRRRTYAHFAIHTLGKQYGPAFAVDHGLVYEHDGDLGRMLIRFRVQPKIGAVAQSYESPSDSFWE